MDKKNIELTTLTDSNADSFLLKFDTDFGNKYILIDGGFKGDGSRAIKIIESIIDSGGCLDLVILTHVDTDHINGLLSIFKSDKINNTVVKKILFNTPHSKEVKIIKEKKQVGYKEGNELLSIINEKKIEHLQAVQGQRLIINNETENTKTNNEKEIVISNDIVIDIIAPTNSALQLNHKKWKDKKIGSENKIKYDKLSLLQEKHKEDNKPQNLSSIVCLITFKNKKLLFCGDSCTSQILSGIKEKTSVNLMKVPHHGSKKNISANLIEMFPTDNYLIPGNKSRYPNPYTIAMLEHYAKDANILVPKRSWVHKVSLNKNIDLNFSEYQFGTKVSL